MIKEASNLKNTIGRVFCAIFFLSLMTASTSAKRNLHAKYRTTSSAHRYLRKICISNHNAFVDKKFFTAKIFASFFLAKYESVYLLLSLRLRTFFLRLNCLIFVLTQTYNFITLSAQIFACNYNEPLINMIYLLFKSVVILFFNPKFIRNTY